MSYPDDIQEFLERGGFARRLTGKEYRHACFRESLGTQRDARRSGYKDSEKECRKDQRKKIKKTVVGA